jgi:tetratricopeptide (TPR) repeat protein
VDQPFKSFKTTGMMSRAASAAILVATLAGVWFGVRWQIGNMLAELTPANQADAADVASFAADLAPHDPLPRLLAAANSRDDFSPGSPNRTAAYLESAIRLAPNDFRIWTELGRAYEQADRPDDSEAAFRRALELAPAYTAVHWQYGNFLLRQDRADEAMAEFRLATEKSWLYRDQVYSLAWDYFDKNTAIVDSFAADTPEARAGLALFYAQRDSGKDAVRVWTSLSGNEKAANADHAILIARTLFARRSFADSLVVARDAGIDDGASSDVITNAGFEDFVGGDRETLFGWQVFRGNNRLDISPDSSVKTEGKRSLKVQFRNYVKPDLYNIAQVVSVQPGARYRLSFRVRTENLRSGAMPLLEVLNARDSSLLARSAPLPSGSSDWQEIAVEFSMPSEGDSIEIRTSREQCADECPIAGTFWYDDFKLLKTSGNT